MDTISITQLKQQAGKTPCSAALDVQLQSCVTKSTKSGKPYLLITLVDSSDQFSLKIWDNLPQYKAIQELPPESFLRLEGEWIQNQYGIDGINWQFRLLNDGEIQQFLSGDPATQEIQQRDWNDILTITADIADPRLHGLCTLFIQKYGDRFRRTAAARKNHHARRGGIVEHVAQMMRCGVAICSVYPDLNRDLIVAAILFHDSGKLWENSYSETGFSQTYTLEGEMLGHIPLGINLIDKLWEELLQSPLATHWDKLTPKNELVRIHLLHLIASHHGTYEYGSPTLPRTPEAHALHHIDNLDAKYEMFKQAYRIAPELAPDILQKQFPLPANLVRPLEHFRPTENQSPNAPTQPAAPPRKDIPKQPTNLDVDNELETKPFTGELF